LTWTVPASWFCTYRTPMVGQVFCGAGVPPAIFFSGDPANPHPFNSTERRNLPEGRGHPSVGRAVVAMSSAFIFVICGFSGPSCLPCRSHPPRISSRLMDSHTLRDGTAYRNRSSGLVVFGVIEIAIGVLCALLVPLSLLGWWVSGSSMTLWSTVPVLVIYAIMAAGLIWLGIGSIRARRWACVLMLSISRIWLATGICSVVVTAFLLPGMLRGFPATAGLPPDVVLAVTAVVLAILSLFYVVLPAAFVLFYRSPDVVATCRQRDPERQFGDESPPRLLTLAALWGLGAVSVLVMPAYDWIFPFFGRLLRGGAGVVPWLAVFGVCCGLAWGSYRRRPWAWWGGVAATVAAAAATVLTSIRIGPEAVVSALPLAEDEMELLASITWPEPWVIIALWVVTWASMLGYLLTLRSEFFGRLATRDD